MKKKVVSLIVLFCIMIVSIGNTALASELSSNEEMYEVIELGDGNVRIIVGDCVSVLNMNTGQLINTKGELVAEIIGVDHENGISVCGYEDPEDPKAGSHTTAIHHNVSLTPNWLYSYSNWYMGKNYSSDLNEAKSAVIALVTFAFGLGATTALQSFIIALAGYVADKHETKAINENVEYTYFYIREYVYCNRYVLSDFKYIKQGYTEDETPHNCA